MSTLVLIAGQRSMIDAGPVPASPLPLMANCGREKCELWNAQKLACALRVGPEKENADA